MKTYTFTYFCGCDRESFYRAQDFTCTAYRLSQALSCFADFFNSLSGYKEFSSCYKLKTDHCTECRYFKSQYFDLFNIVRPDFLEEIQ